MTSITELSDRSYSVDSSEDSRACSPISEKESPLAREVEVNEPIEDRIPNKIKSTILLRELKSTLKQLEVKHSPEIDKISNNLKNQYLQLNPQDADALADPQNRNAFIDERLQGTELIASQDLGGHGGTYQVRIEIDGTRGNFFLKPRDEVEANNYKMIHLYCPQLAQIMPKIYGEVEINNQLYLIMENVRLDSDGTKLEQLVDIKLAGKTGEKDFNPIANQAEMVATRKRSKSSFDFWQMQKGAEKSPNYMIAKGSPFMRFFNYSESEETLLNSLIGFSTRQLEALQREVNRIQSILKESPFAMIGASVIFIRNKDRSIRPLLIDPAHMQVDPDREKEIQARLSDLGEDFGVYYGEKKDFTTQRESNSVALTSICDSIKKSEAYHPPKNIPNYLPTTMLLRR